MIHVKTQKGKGYSYAEKASDHYHGVSKFNVVTGEQVKSGTNLPAYTKVFANILVKHAERDSKVVGVTAAMPGGTGMDIFAKDFPKRMFDVGIAEQHGVTFAKVTPCCSAIPTSNILFGKSLAKISIPVPPGIAAVTPTTLLSLSACLTKMFAKTFV